MLEVDKELFFKIQEQMDYVSHMQGRGELESQILEQGKPVVYFVNDQENPKMCCWGEISHKPVIGKMLRIYGEAGNGKLNSSEVKKFYEQLVEYVGKKYAFILVSSDNLYDVNYEIGIRQAGFVRPMKLSLCPLSILLDFENEKPRKKSWKYQLAQAKRMDLQFKVIETPDESDIKMFVDMYAEMAQTKRMNYRHRQECIAALLKDPAYRLFVMYTPEGKPLAAHIDYFHQKWAYHISSANSNLAREMRGTTHLLMENVFEWMKGQGVQYYDMGRIGPSTGNMNSVYEFKKYSGGEPIQYNGEWIFINKAWVEYLLAYRTLIRW